MTTILDSYEKMPAPDTVLLHASSLDFRDSTGILYGSSISSPLAVPTGPHIDHAMNLWVRIHGLKLRRESSSRALDIARPNIDSLRTDSNMALGMLHRLAGISLELNLDETLYGLADIPSMRAVDLAPIYEGSLEGRRTLVRAEEGLTPHAADIADSIKRLSEKKAIDFTLSDDGRKAFRPTRSGGQAKLPLYQYTFTHGPGSAVEREFFPDFPSCETFLAATVLEQVAIGETVIRAVPSTFINKEYSARSLLGALGLHELPVLSIAISPSGNLTKLFPWQQQEPSSIIKEFMSELKNDRRHVLSTSTAKQIHDTVYHEHREYYDRYRLRDRAAPPATYLEDGDILSRVARFEIDGTPAAPLYEAHRISADQVDAIISELLSAGVALDFELSPPETFKHTVELVTDGHHEPAIASRIMFRLRNNQIISDSTEAMLIVHAVFEDGNEHKKDALSAGVDSYFAYMQRMKEIKPRYVLLEVRRAMTASQMQRKMFDGLFRRPKA